MTDRPSQPDDLADAAGLIARLHDGRLSVGQARTLEALVMANPAVRRAYVLARSLHADLFLHAPLLSPAAAGTVADPHPGGPPPPPDDLAITPATQEDRAHSRATATAPASTAAAAAGRPGSPRRGRTLSRAAVLVLGGSAAVWVAVHHRRVVQDAAGRAARESSEPAWGSGDLARLDLSLDPTWDGPAPAGGAVGAAGGLHLKAGLARLLLRGGAAVVVEGPADVSLETGDRLRLAGGRLTVRAPHTPRGFTVDTPAATVTDLGTEFGVAVGPAAGQATGRADAGPDTSVSVFDGAVRLDRPVARQGEAARVVRAGQAWAVTPDAIVPVTAGAAFVRDGEFGRRRRAVDAATATIADPDLLAHAFFDPDFDRLAAERHLPAGLPWRSADGPPGVQVGGEGVVGGGVAGRRLSLRGERVAFVDLDTSPAGPLGRQGYLDADGFVGATGKTLYMSWRSTAERASASGFGGVSLVDGDAHLSDEYLFVGQAFGTSNFSCHLWRAGREPLPAPAADAVHDLDADPDRPGTAVRPVDGKTHLWVVRVDFRAGNDRISVFLDPPPAEPPKPDLLVGTVDLRFRGFRLTSGPNDEWTFGRFLLARTFNAVVPG